MFDNVMELGSKTTLDLQSSLWNGDIKKFITQKKTYLLRIQAQLVRFHYLLE
jgi:hypothetical protein